MRTLYPGLLGIACCAFVLNCSGQAVSGANAIETAPESSHYSVPTNSESASTPLPDSPSYTLTARAFSPQSQSPETSAPAPKTAQQQDSNPQRPVGTAAAEAPKVNGITAAQPAGVAIAPAKQKRVRTIVLRVGVIVGAGAALGTVIALTEGTSSKPPGAH